VRVEATQELSDGEAEQLVRQVESTVRSAITKAQDELQRKYPSAQLTLTLKHG
jgi:hypothetical protein